MKYLVISGQEPVSRISEAFNRHFPFLKLQFFRKHHEVNAPSAKKEMIDGSVISGTVAGFRAHGKMSLDPDMSVAELEQQMHERFGLNAHVFRSSGSLWLETSSTDQMTLKQQNELGHEKSFPVEKQDANDFDYD